MEAVYSWCRMVFVEPSVLQTLVILTLVSAVGLILGKLRLGRISLGITFVFFVGILAAHFGVVVQPEMSSFAQTLGLTLFVYALGVEVGPSFFPSLKSQGILYNGLGLLLITLGLLLVVILHYSFGISMPNMMGIMSGAVTNTPMLAAVQSTLQDIVGLEGTRQVADLALACALTYPLGVVGMILAILILQVIEPKRQKEDRLESKTTYITELELTNPGLFSKSILEVVRLQEKHFIISRVWRGDKLIVPTSQTLLQGGDHLLLLIHEEDLGVLEAFFGRRSESRDWNRPDIDWDAIDAQLITKRLIITNGKINGIKLGALRLRNEYGINITRIDRAGIEILASPELHLQLGDRLTVVGEAQEIAKAKKFIGDSINTLDKPKLVSFFAGLALGCILGSIPVAIPGLSMPIKLGLAGGPIIIGILMGAFGPRLRIATYMTNSATQLIKQLGIILYLAGLGLASGAHFFETIIHGDGLLWIFLGFLITLLPTLLVGIVSLFGYRKTHAETVGLLCGAMANSMALDYAMSLNESRSSSVAYAIVYPVAMFVRIISAQILLSFFV
ncbi:putative transporter [Porphyromonas sp. oral taxon 275]|uniref:putative transporter n=1 Tax=Porphyromonas sp. oral taxon 275 TaxID=712435 RepID=UPI001BAA0006|nr:putative transporter [Porphyromonas sp. oral taxon 275]QUB43322.1 putative transporter [Porphyromonas sp. oral taxon 275]